MCDDARGGEETMGLFSRDRQMPAAVGKGAKFSFIGPEVTVTGDIVTSGQLHVDGKVAGDIDCGVLSQGESGEVRGNIVAGEARLAGLIDGSVEAATLELERSARVTGDILYETLSIRGGAQVEGRFRLRKGAGDGSKPARPETGGAAPSPAAAPPLPFPGKAVPAEAAE
jgi:cytoskeletal protein CcmA (bactofilin family)